MAPFFNVSLVVCSSLLSHLSFHKTFGGKIQGDPYISMFYFYIILWARLLYLMWLGNPEPLRYHHADADINV